MAKITTVPAPITAPRCTISEIKPLDRNIIAQVRIPEAKIGSILIANVQQRTGPVYCTVLAVGPNVKTVKVGSLLAIYPNKAVVLEPTLGDVQATIVFQEDFEKVIIGSV